MGNVEQYELTAKFYSYAKTDSQVKSLWEKACEEFKMAPYKEQPEELEDYDNQGPL